MGLMPKRWKTIHIEVDEVAWRGFRAGAVARGETISAAVARLIEDGTEPRLSKDARRADEAAQDARRVHAEATKIREDAEDAAMVDDWTARGRPRGAPYPGDELVQSGMTEGPVEPLRASRSKGYTGKRPHAFTPKPGARNLCRQCGKHKDDHG